MCWTPYGGPPDWMLTSTQTSEDEDGFAYYLAEGGETIREISRMFLLTADRTQLITQHNPAFTETDLLRQGVRIKVPLWNEHTTIEKDTLASIAKDQLGHVAYSTLIFGANRTLFEGDEDKQTPGRYGVLVDAN